MSASWASSLSLGRGWSTRDQDKTIVAPHSEGIWLLRAGSVCSQPFNADVSVCPAQLEHKQHCWLSRAPHKLPRCWLPQRNIWEMQGVALNSNLYFVLAKCIKNSMKPFCHYQRYLAGIKCLFTSDEFAARFILLSPPDWITVILYLHVILSGFFCCYFFFFFPLSFLSIGSVQKNKNWFLAPGGVNYLLSSLKSLSYWVLIPIQIDLKLDSGSIVAL